MCDVSVFSQRTHTYTDLLLALPLFSSINHHHQPHVKVKLGTPFLCTVYMYGYTTLHYIEPSCLHVKTSKTINDTHIFSLQDASSKKKMLISHPFKSHVYAQKEGEKNNQSFSQNHY